MKTLKKIIKLRPLLQSIFLILTILGFFINFQITMVLILITTVLGGPYFCGWVCPYGFIQDLFSKLGKRLGIKKRKMPKSIQKYLQFTRYILFALFTFFTIDIIFTLLTYDPRSNFDLFLLGYSIQLVAILVLISFGLIALFFERPFCNYLCIQGAKYGLFSFLRPFTIKRNTDTCINCKKCSKACPMNIDVSTCHDLRSPQCINCFECVNVCPVENTLTYGLVNHKTLKGRIYYGVAAIALIIGLIVLTLKLTSQESTESNTTNTVEQNTSVINTESNTQINTTLPTTTTETTDSSVTTNTDTNTDTDTDTETSDATTSTNDISTTTETISPTTAAVIETIPTGKYIDGTYTGTGKGFRGDITVEVIVEQGDILSVEIISNRDDARWFDRAEASVPDDIIEAQDIEVDTVSGATYSSLGIIDAVEDALKNARN